MLDLLSLRSPFRVHCVSQEIVVFDQRRLTECVELGCLFISLCRMVAASSSKIPTIKSALWHARCQKNTRYFNHTSAEGGSNGPTIFSTRWTGYRNRSTYRSERNKKTSIRPPLFGRMPRPNSHEFGAFYGIEKYSFKVAIKKLNGMAPGDITRPSALIRYLEKRSL
jgi:hypothetical protein